MDPHPVMWAYCDGSWIPECDTFLSGIGVALWDQNGELLTLSRGVSTRLPPHYLEPLAILTALEIGWEVGARWMIVHCDCEQTIDRLQGRAPYPKRAAAICYRARQYMLRFQQVTLVPIDRSENTQAHELARIGLLCPWDKVWWRGQKTKPAKAA